jgi:ABC-type phosphate transport system substrate-binding protein
MLKIKHPIAAALLLAAGGASAQVAVVMSPSAAPLTKDQVANIYLGRSFDLKPVDLPEASPVREQFYKKATERDLAQVKATWSRIVFSGKGQPPKEVADAAAVKKAVAADPKAIGYIEKGAVDGTVKAVLTLD